MGRQTCFLLRAPSHLVTPLTASGVHMSSDAWSDCLIVCPLQNSSIEEWCIVVIVIGYTLFVTSQYDVIFTCPNQRLAKFVDTTCILFYTHSSYLGIPYFRD